MKIRLLTVVWGAAYVDRMMRLTVRSLMAPGNLPRLVATHKVVHEVHAPAADIDLIRSRRSFAAWARLVDVRFRPFEVGDIAAGNPMEHWRLWHRGVADARKEDTSIILVAPDQILADGALTRWVWLLDHGYDAVFCTGFQVVMETVCRALDEQFAIDQAIVLTVPELHRLALDHLHPIMIGMLRGSPRCIPHPEWHLRAVTGGGIVQRVLASHAYAFRPSRIKLSDSFCPVEKLDRVAFEPPAFVGAEPLLKQAGYFLRPSRMDDTTLSYYGVWARQFMAPVNLLESKINHLLHIGAASSTPAFQAAQRGADFFVGQLIASRAIVMLVCVLHDKGLELASRWLAAGHLHARMRRRMPLRGPVTVFVPGDDVIDRIPTDEAKRLLSDRGKSLLTVLRAHTAPGHHRLKPGSRISRLAGGNIATLAGDTYGVAENGQVRVLQGPFQIDDIEVYEIDDLLVSIALHAPRKGSRLRSIQRRMRNLADAGARRGREVLIALLRRSDRLYRTALWFWIRVWYLDALSSAENRVDPRGLAQYKQAAALRSLAALHGLVEFHAREVLGRSPYGSPLSMFVRQYNHWSSDEVIQLLLNAISADSCLSEAWLELGYARLEVENESGALEAFQQAQELSPSLPYPLGHPDVSLLAAVERAKLLERAGRADESLACLDAVASHQFAPWEYFLCRARVLVKLGRTSDALQSFAATLRWAGAKQHLAGMLPNDLADLHRASTRQR
jgi:tetratricopeptide (TPR) repeat protein